MPAYLDKLPLFPPIPDRFRWTKLWKIASLWPLALIMLIVGGPLGIIMVDVSANASQMFVMCGLPITILLLITGIIFYFRRRHYERCALALQAQWQPFADEHQLVIEGRGGWPKSVLFDVSGSHLYGQINNGPFHLHTWHEAEQDFTIIQVSVNDQVSEIPLPGLAFLDQDVVRFLAGYGIDFDAQSRFLKNTYALGYRTPGILTDTHLIKNHIRLLYDLSDAYPFLVWAGGEYVTQIVALLQDQSASGIFEPLLKQLLADIETKTTARFADRLNMTFCRNCYTQFGRHQIQVSRFSKMTYYGCRLCGLSRSHFEGNLVAVLNGNSLKATWEADDVLFVNWSVRRKLFDFTAVEIVNATEKDIEQFVIQVKNDIGPLKDQLYQSIQCTVAPSCIISRNSEHLLRETFTLVV